MTNLLIGVCGSSAVQDLPGYLIQLQQKLDATIRVILSPVASQMISKALLGSMANVRVYSDLFERDDMVRVPHTDLTDWADLFMIMPATANTMAKIAHGMADNLLTLTVIAWARPVILFPNMNPKMWNTSAVQRNAHSLVDFGHRVVAPTGNMTVTATGIKSAAGHMPAPDGVIEFITKLLKEEQVSWKPS